MDHHQYNNIQCGFLDARDDEEDEFAPWRGVSGNHCNRMRLATTPIATAATDADNVPISENRNDSAIIQEDSISLSLLFHTDKIW